MPLKASAPLASLMMTYGEASSAYSVCNSAPVGRRQNLGDPPAVFNLKRGNPPVGGSTLASAPWLTREYQVCLKCHSTYAYNKPPELGQSRGGTPPGTNAVRRYTDQAMEFQAPPGDKGERISLSLKALASDPWREATANLVAHLAELDARRLYLGAGFPSLFTYCCGSLGLSEHETYNRIEAARVGRRFPRVLELLAEVML